MQNNLTNPKKVLYVITKSNWGGAQRYVYDLATNLDRTVFEPVVAMGGNGTLVEMLNHAGIRTIPLQAMQNSTGLRANLQSLQELRTIIRTEKPAILHLNSSVAGIVGALAGRIARVPRIIFTAHGWAFNEDRPWVQRLVFKAIHYLTVVLCHHTIAVSRAIVAEMNWPRAVAKMTVINPGRTIGVMFERADARQTIADFFPQVTPYMADPWIVCVAELHPIKRHIVLFEAVRSLTAIMPQVRLLCFGEGVLRTELETWVQNHGMSEHIFICGNLHEAARFLKAFDCFVLVSKSESYGYVIHEAGLAGVPVVATDVGGIRDIITHEETGLLTPVEDTSAIAGNIYTILHNSPNPAATALQQRLKQALTDRTVLEMARATSRIYNK